MSSSASGSRRVVVIKIGGRPATQDTTQRVLGNEICAMLAGVQFVIVHGGGAEVSRVSRALGFEPVFRDGIRMTTPGEMEIVDMVLAGKVNKEMVRRLTTCGVPAFGISGADGGLIVGESVGAIGDNRTGTVRTVDARPLELLVGAGFTPVISSVATDGAGTGLNINADEAALDIAAAMRAERLIFFSDIPGVLKNGEVIRTLTAERAEAEIAEGTISGGMIPKVRSSVAALQKGVGAIVIGEYRNEGDLAAFVAGSSGTSIVRS